MNQIFGYQKLPQDKLNSIVFSGTHSVMPSSYVRAKSPQIQLVAEDHTNLQSCYSQQYQSYSYVWGIPVHPKISSSDIPEWCARIVAQERYELFKELIGTFIVIIDEPCQHRITFITDILGVRPMFIGNYNGRFVFGSNVWSMYKNGFCSGKINYDAVSSWIAYGYNCTNGSLFFDLHRVLPGTVVVLQDEQYTEISYTEFTPKLKTLNSEHVAEKIHGIVSSSTNTLLAQYNRFTISLSGGFDSRYLLALIALHGKASFDCVTVDHIPEETQIASEVTKILGVSLEKYTVEGAIWDKYDQVYHSTADGFPITKNVNYCVVQQYPQVPIINGYIGGTLKGFGEKIWGKSETECNAELADILQRRHLQANLMIIRREISRRIQERSRVPMEKAVQAGTKIGKVFNWANLYYRQRLYIANNFLQHLEFTEAVLPYYSWEFISCMMEYDSKIFTWDLYNKIFQSYFPKLAEIPHSRELISEKVKLMGVARCTKIWARELFPIVLEKDYLTLLEKKWGISYSLAGLLGITHSENTIFFLKRLYLLEKSLRDVGLDFDWDYI